MDLQTCVDLLAARAAPRNPENAAAHGCGCHGHQGPFPVGQTLRVGPDAADAPPTPAGGDANAERLTASLGAATEAEVFEVLWRAQADRTAALRRFDGELDDVLESENLDAYPSIVAEATALFAAISNTVKAVEATLRERGKRVEAGLVRRLQEQEKEHLTLTAAMHLDYMRAFHLEAAGVGAERDLRLVGASLEGVRRRRQSIEAAINETLEELRCEAMGG